MEYVPAKPYWSKGLCPCFPKWSDAGFRCVPREEYIQGPKISCWSSSSPMHSWICSHRKSPVLLLIVPDRVPKPCQETNSCEKKGGASVSVVRRESWACNHKWFDHKKDLMASTIHGKDPEDICIRWSNKEKVQPRQYNDNMSGVDLFDRRLSFNRISNRTKKWTSRVIAHFFDVAITKSWIQYKSESRVLNRPAKNTQQYLDFKLHLPEELLDSPKSWKQESKQWGRICATNQDEDPITRGICAQTRSYSHARDDGYQACRKMQK